MAQNFESKLVEISSEERLKSAKQLLKNSKLKCAYRDESGAINATFQGNTAYDHTRVTTGDDPKCECSCSEDDGKLCEHAVAAVMYCSRFKPVDVSPVDDGASGYSGLKYESLDALAMKEALKAEAKIYIQTEAAFPHVPSKWENAVLSVKLSASNGKDYIGNLNNVRQLYFDKSLAVTLKLSDFSLHDQQIIRFLAVNAEGESSKLLLNSEQTAEFFHCLVGFDRFTRNGRKLIVNPDTAEPIILRRRDKDGVFVAPGISVNNAVLAVSNAKVITGRAGCWIGCQGEYFFVPGTVDVGWLRNFFRGGEQLLCDKSLTVILNNGRFPLKVVDVDSFDLAERECSLVLDGGVRNDGALYLVPGFLYENVFFKYDEHRLAPLGKKFWKRDEKFEAETIQELKMFGFEEEDGAFVIRDTEASGVFLDRMLPMWLKNRKHCVFSTQLARLCRGGCGVSPVEMSCSVSGSDAERFYMNYKLSGDGGKIDYDKLLAFVKKGASYFVSGGKILNITPDFGRFIRQADNVMEKRSNENLSFELPRYSLCYWRSIGENIPGVVPAEIFDFAMNEIPITVGDAGALCRGHFKGELRKYQQEGASWMRGMLDNNFNVILADEMGLGKTVQTLSVLAADRSGLKEPSLIICPASLVENWNREAQKFVPDFKVAAMIDCDRELVWENAVDYDLIIVSYAVARRDGDTIRKIKFNTLVLDEAQHIKNPSTANAQSCKAVKARHRVVLTGTPLENSSEDLWSIFDFLQPGMLGTFAHFKRYYSEIKNDHGLQNDLARRVAPFIKRRTKAEVCTELPPKQELKIFCEMEDSQRQLYNEVLEKGRQQLAQLSEHDSKVNFEVLTTLLRLRQICCDPALLPDYRNGIPSAKFDLLKELVLQNVDSGHKLLLFSQFTSLLSLVRTWLDGVGVKYEYLDGATRNRQQRVDEFNNNKDIQIFLLSLKAGGTGLNLTSADTVIIYDPWWNPAVELQAADRTHRIGQTRAVTSIKLLVKDSIEERILDLQARKQDIFNNIIDNPAAHADKFTIEELKMLFY